MLRGCIVHSVSRFEAKLVERDFGYDAIVIEHGVDELVKSFTGAPRIT